LGGLQLVRSSGKEEGEAPRHLDIRKLDLDRAVIIVVVAGDLPRQELADERQEGARALLGLCHEIVAASGVGERAQDHLAQIPRELVRRALPASAGLVSLGHEDRVTDPRSDALNARAPRRAADLVGLSRKP
jgi:hypothetical protein